MQRNRIRNQKTRNGLGILAATIGIAILLFAAMAPAVSASEKVYGSGQVIFFDYNYPWWSPNYYHFGIIYNVPYNPSYKPYIGGVDQNIVNQYVSEDHKNVQNWERMTYTSSQTMLLIPKTYVLHTTSRYLPSEIYLEFPVKYW